MKKIIFFLFFAAQLSAQNITVYSGYQRLSVTPEIAAKFDLKQSQILTPETFEQVKTETQKATVKTQSLAVIGNGTPENPYRIAPTRPGENFTISNDTVYTNTGRRFFENGEWVFIPKK